MTPIPPVAELVAGASEKFERARNMPPSVYTSPAFLERELKDVFAREWVSVGRASALSTHRSGSRSPPFQALLTHPDSLDGGLSAL